MICRQSASIVEVHAPAKLNLYFQVLGRRNDGFHEVDTLMCAVTLYDTLTVFPTPTPEIEFRLDTSSLSRRLGAEQACEIAPGDGNLVVRAARLLQRRAGANQGAILSLYKRIPATAGLGGGSSDAAAALLACDKAWDLGWSRDRLSELACELGSDVPFFLGPNSAICRGRGELQLSAPRLGHLHFVIVRPSCGLSTAAVYAACELGDGRISGAEAVDALADANWKKLPTSLTNDLRDAAWKLSPGLEEVRREFPRWGCTAHEMTGSGSGYFGICRTRRQARRLGAQLRSRRVGAVFVARCNG